MSDFRQVFGDDFLLWLIAAGGILAWAIWKKCTPFFTKQSYEEPILASELLTSTGLAGLHKGTITGYSYNLMSTSSGDAMVMVSLPKSIGVHLVGFSNANKLSDVPLKARARLESFNLEGDFPEYFEMYCRTQDQSVLREVFDPKMMAYFADFCQSYNLEIFKDIIYFSYAGEVQDDDDTTMIEDVERFLAENQRLFSSLGREL